MNEEAVKGIFSRTERLLGAGMMERLTALRVILFGVGGVGSWCAESLIRTGVGHLTIVDPDLVCPSNVNRQLMATTATLGRSKAVVLRERLLQINPAAHVEALTKLYSADTAQDFDLDRYDYVIDAIDSLADKKLLILHACHSRARFFSSMGAAMKSDPSRIHVAEFWKVKGCPLAAALRRKFRKEGPLPARKFKCVFSDELLPNLGEAFDEFDAPPSTDGLKPAKPRPNGTLAHITGIFGLTLAGLVVQDLLAAR